MNLTSSSNTFEINATDDDGNTAGPVTFSVPGNEAFEVTSAELESGGSPLSGSLGDGSGKWRMTLSSSQSAKVLSLLEDPDGNISNLSNAIVPEDDQYLINYMLPDDASQEGFIRFINNSNSATTVTIEGIDEEGNSDTITLSLGANEGRHLNSGDIENGNTNKGLSGSLGDGAGAWRLLISANQDIDVVGLFRTSDGFVNTVHNNTNFVAATSHFVPFFNPASNPNQVSTIRLNNPGNTSNTFTIAGMDYDGTPGVDVYEVTLQGNTSRTISSDTLESFWGDGNGKWRVDITSTRDSYVQSLLTAPGDLLSNLSNFLPLPGSETQARTESWIINNSETSRTIVDSHGDPALVNVQSVTETTFNNQAVVQVNATGVPNYTHLLTQAEVDWLNNRPNSGSDFRGMGGRTTAEPGPVNFGEDINYDSSNDCVEGEGRGYWPPGPVCPLDVEHQVYLPDNPAAASTECELGLDTVGLWINGVSVYGYSDGMSYNFEGVWTNLAPAFEVYDIDVCHGHAANNDYHHHSYPHCLAEQIGDVGTDHSPVYGFAQDGYPIYGPWQSNGVLAESCWIARDYSAATSAGGCEDGTRSCQLVDNMDVSQGVASASAGPGLTEEVISQSGNPILAESGVYFEDYYYSADCSVQGEAYLDQYNGHDTDDGRGYHYHVTVTDDSQNQTLGIDYYPRFPYFLGPSIYGEVDTQDTEWRCNGLNSRGWWRRSG